MTEPHRTVFRTADGLDLVADRYGAPIRGGVLLAHGGGQTRHAWAKTAAALADRGWEAVALDLRGHGDSGRPALIGASLGGLAGLLAEAEIAPRSFSSITLVDIVPNMDMDGAAKVMGFMSAHIGEGFASLEEAADVISSYLPHRPRPSNLSGLAKNLRCGGDGRYRWHWDPSFVASANRERSRRDAQAFDAGLASLALPVHLIRGRLSELVTREAAEDFVATVKNAQFTDVAGASHMVAGDRNDAFLDAVVGFLDRLEPV
ncbi:MAG: alpha/beta hydrolase [Caulobacter vibrioides]|uniref:Alpha/beta hydrolase n=1 Tax=Caulobacter vibrioides TaxID=155892 RepID=A0A258D290_CAUVI|nr:MAG: alpha/beta hydrolase [Caulobacter vibrioides]